MASGFPAFFLGNETSVSPELLLPVLVSADVVDATNNKERAQGLFDEILQVTSTMDVPSYAFC